MTAPKVERKVLLNEFNSLIKKKDMTKTKAYMQLAEKHGYANYMNVYHAIRRIKKKQNGNTKV